MYKAILLCTGMLFCWAGNLAALNQTLYINSGTYTAIDNNTFERLAFNTTSTFDAENVRLHIAVGDSINFTIINTDSVPHGFSITGGTAAPVTIPAGSTLMVNAHFPAFGSFIYYDHLSAPDYRYLGLAGMLVVDDSNAAPFYWNLKEHQKAYNDALYAGAPVDWNTYYPDYFTINSYSNPDINADPAARVVGSVGQTIRIYITNTGQSTHSMHFHGYHCTIVYSSQRAIDVGRSKDTFPIKSMETMILELVPDKVGEYPVHDHNLVATTGGTIHPNGMFTTLLIQ